MADVKGSGRPYSSPLRSQQAAQTRAAVLGAARELFLTLGYGATTVDQIAADAGVSKPTVFTAVGNKQSLLAAVRDVAMAGDDEPVAVSERPSVQKALAEPDPYRAAKHLAAHMTALAERYARINEVLRGAAASGVPELRTLWQTSEDQRLAGARLFVASLEAKCRLTLPEARAVDLMWLLMDTQNYQRLVGDRGWTRVAYQRWLADTIRGTFLPPPQPGT